MLFFLVGYVLSFLLANRIQGQAIESVESDVVEVLVPRLMRQLNATDLEQGLTPERHAEISAFVSQSILSNKILGVRIFDIDGEVVFEKISPTLDDEGTEEGHSEIGGHLAEALGGIASSGIEHADPTTSGYTPDLVETYAPIRFDGSAEIVGAFEIYEDYSLAAGHVASIQRLVTWGLVAGLLSAYLLLMWFTQRSHGLVLRQHKLLEEQRDDLQKANVKISSSEERFRSLVLNVSDVILVVDAAGNIQYASPSVEAAWHRSPTVLEESCLYDLVSKEDETAITEALSRVRFAPGAHTSISFAIDADSGKEKNIDATVTNLLTQASVSGIVLSCRDVTERKRFEERLTLLAYHDTLTNLPNRRMFMQGLEAAVTKVDEEHTLALLLVDIDHFKATNDSHGHPAGDALLVEVSERLKSAAPGSEVGRLGGDEFAILLRVASENDAKAVAKEIMNQFSVPFRYDGASIAISVSVGMAIAMADETVLAAGLVRSADVAMYRSKADGGGSYVIANSQMEEDWRRRQELENDLRGVVERDELRLHYQPVIELKSGRVVGMEALIRWQHPERGLIPPTDFIGLAESTGHILEIGRWVRETAFKQTKEWTDKYPHLSDFRIRINLSAVELEQSDLVWGVASALRDTDLDPSLVEIEVTESVVMRDPVEMSARLRELANLGIQMAIDDFGTGYSSLGYLRMMPVGTLKIDRCFVTDLKTDPISQTLIEAMVVLGGSLGFNVVAEGIETIEQQELLIELGCPLGQGFLFARPMDSEAASAALDATASGPSVHWRAAGA